jgi:hypothetical protein
MTEWDFLTKIYQEHGIISVAVLVALVAACYWIHKLYEGRLQDRQQQIDRLAEENRQYRDIFMRLISPPKEEEKE